MRSVGKEIKDIDNLIFRKLIKDNPNHKCISPVQLSIMKYLMEHNSPIYQKDMECELHLRKSTISGILDTMEKNKMIVRKTSSTDTRKKEITLTDLVYSKANELKIRMQEFDKMLIKGISKDNLDIFYMVTEQIKNNLKEEK